MMCPGCKRFDEQSEFIDKSIKYFSDSNATDSEINLPQEKKSEIKNTVNQSIK